MPESNDVPQLAALIEAQMSICDEMIALSQREQQALARFRPARLPELLAAQDDCAERFARTQEALDAAVRSAADAVGLAIEEGQTLDVHTLLPYLPPEERARLAALRGAVEERAYTLAVLNAQNALLVRTGLLQLDQTAGVLSTVLGEPRSYGAGGNARIPSANDTLFLNHQA